MKTQSHGTSRDRRVPFACVIAVVTLLAVFAAHASASPTLIYTCVKKKTGTIRIVTASTKCHKGEAKLSWNAHGQTGANGKSGTNGANGAAGTNGANGAVAGYSTTGAEGVEILTGSEEHPVTVASLSLPAGNFIVQGDAYVFLRDEESTAEILGICGLVDTNSVGQGVATQNVGWVETVTRPFFFGYVADVMLPLALAVSSPEHASTVALNCYPETATSTGNFHVVSDDSVITAIQTTQNG
jgi:hypothetical protein